MYLGISSKLYTLIVKQPKARNNGSNPHIIYNTKMQVTYHKTNLGIHQT